MEIAINIVLIIAAFCFMEGVAWFTHKYVMHGFLWRWHKSHHEPRYGIFELNDLFSVIFGTIGAGLIILGAELFDYRFFIGLGISLYGMAYFAVHDIFIHQRVKLLRNTRYAYFKAMRKAHKIHHKRQSKEQGEAFGFLYVPPKYRNI